MVAPRRLNRLRIKDDLTFGDDNIAMIFDETRQCWTLLPTGFAAEIRGLNMAKDRYELVERFQKAPKLNADILSATEATNEIVNRDFELLGTNAVSADCALYVEGGVTLATHGAASDSSIILPHLDANESAWATTTWGTDQRVRWECVIQTPAAVTAVKIWAGLKLTNTPTIATDNDQAYFFFDTATAGGNATYWHGIYSISGTDTDTALTTAPHVAVTAATSYHLCIDIDSNRIARFYVNGALGLTSTALADAIDLIPYIGIIDTSAGSARAMRVFKQAISRKAGV